MTGKRLSAALLCLLLLLSLAPGTALAEEPGTLSVGTVDGTRGGTVRISG